MAPRCWFKARCHEPKPEFSPVSLLQLLPPLKELLKETLEQSPFDLQNQKQSYTCPQAVPAPVLDILAVLESLTFCVASD
jgi:hypothetical protein